ncbi:hypothetical protein CR513_41704, partial [Mucuna pruriens]
MRALRTLDPISMTYTELLPLLLKEKLLETVPVKPLKPPYPRSYDPNARCDYHGREDKSQEVKPEGTSKVGEREEEVGCSTNSASRVEEGPYQSRPNRVESDSIAYIGGSDNPRPKLLTVHYNSASQPREPFIIKVSARPAYTNNNAVPRRGDNTSKYKGRPNPKGHKHSGDRRGDLKWKSICPQRLAKQRPYARKKDKAVEVPNKIVTKGEASEFLKLIHHNEYEMLDQMHKTLA